MALNLSWWRNVFLILLVTRVLARRAELACKNLARHQHLSLFASADVQVPADAVLVMLILLSFALCSPSFFGSDPLSCCILGL